MSIEFYKVRVRREERKSKPVESGKGKEMTSDLIRGEPVATSLLKRIELFEGLSASELGEMSSVMRLHRIDPPQEIVREGEPGESVFFIAEGTLEVVRSAASGEFELNVLRSGDFFGEMAVLDRQPRSASVRAKTPVLLLELDQDGFCDFFERNPRAARIVLRRFSSRMRGIMSKLEEQLDRVHRAKEEIRTAYDDTVRALCRALDLRDTETEGHSLRVMDLAEKFAKRLGFSPPEVEAVRRGALLHDVGKVGVPDSILKKPASLTTGEMEVIREHPEWGYRMLKDIAFLRSALPIIRHHHEKYDGSGYPGGLRGEEIPLAARLFAIVDAYDAMTSDRPYRKAIGSLQALEELERCAGTHFDPRLVAIFKEIIEKEDVLSEG